MTLCFQPLKLNVRALKWVHCLFLFPPCYWEKVKSKNVTCKIVSFLCSLDNFLLKNAIVFFFFFFNKISKWRSFEKWIVLTYFTHFLVTRGKYTKISQHISHLHTRILLILLTFLLYQFCKIVNLSCMVSLWCDSWC